MPNFVYYWFYISLSNMVHLVIFILLHLAAAVLARKGFGPTDQEWDFVTVRKDAHIFWWLHYTTAPNAIDRPLVIWLQGGPGSSSTGFGNFAELGPLDENLNARNFTWVNNVNVLFVDNPVGTGYSYVDNLDALTKDNKQIADDFLKLLQDFFKKYAKFIGTPLYIVSESYGGKMAAEIALHLQKAIDTGDINCNFKGVGLGDSWISPIDSVMSWAPYLLQLGAIDAEGFREIQQLANATQKAVNEKRFEDATDLWSQTEYVIALKTYGIDFYNVLEKTSENSQNLKIRSLTHKSDLNEIDAKIDALMHNNIKTALNISDKVIFGSQNSDVFSKLAKDFMKPVTNIVEKLLDTTNLKVIVFNGQLDLIVDTPGTINWVDRLKWHGINEWKNAERAGFLVNGFYEGYVKKSGNLAFYWVNRAGHMVPSDNPAAMDFILRDLTNNYNSN